MSNRRVGRDSLSSEALFGVDYVPPAVAALKRGLDIAAALVILLITAPIWPIIALAIKLDSPGPVFYRQLRVGRVFADRSTLFMMVKFRSMREDAERGTGAVWAIRRDPRITRVGRILRKTRLDELPQLLNVLAGDMSMIGPRPERPVFYRRLVRIAPCFADRTAGLRPGITGLAQVRQGYDTCEADAVRKLGYDAAYAMRLADFGSWLATDLMIVGRTMLVMLTGRGQ